MTYPGLRGEERNTPTGKLKMFNCSKCNTRTIGPEEYADRNDSLCTSCKARVKSKR